MLTSAVHADGLHVQAEAFGNISTNLLGDYITANTMYYEGKAYPCGETPPAAASAVMDWMLMEWGGVVRIFAGIDDAQVVRKKTNTK